MLGKVATGIVVAILTLGGSAPSAIQQPLPIIDMHMHVLGPLPRTTGGDVAPRLCFPKPCTEAPTLAKTEADVLRMTLDEMRKHNIVLGFLSGNVPDVQAWVRAAPDRFLPAPLIYDPSAADLTMLRAAFKNGTLRGVGELANQYEGIAANDPRMEPLFAMAEEFDLPVLIHSCGTAGPSDKFRIDQGHPALLQEVLMKHPRLRLYLENAAFPFLEETISLMYRYPNVNADLSTVSWIFPRPVFHRYLAALVDAGLGKRLMFGSDQMWWPETITMAIDAIESARFLSQDQKRDIFYNNAARFLRLDEKKSRPPIEVRK